jgi:hypothetical protein
MHGYLTSEKIKQKRSNNEIHVTTVCATTSGVSGEFYSLSINYQAKKERKGIHIAHTCCR